MVLTTAWSFWKVQLTTFYSNRLPKHPSFYVYDCLQAHYGITWGKKKVLIQSESCLIGVKARMLKELQKSLNIQDSIGLKRDLESPLKVKVKQNHKKEPGK